MRRPLGSILICGWLSAAPGAAEACDVVPPQLTGVSIQTPTLDVSTQSQAVSIRVRATDPVAGGCGGVRSVGLFLHAPTSGQSRQLVGSRISGTAGDGWWDLGSTIPQHAEPGAWTIRRLYLVDEVGNRTQLLEADLLAAGYPTQVQVVSATPDLAPPALSDLAGPGSVNVGAGAQSGSFELEIQDTPGGLAGASVFVRSSSGAQWKQLVAQRISGDAVAGRYRATTTFSTHTETGTWTVTRVALTDAVGNSVDRSTASLAAAGFDTAFDVVGVAPDTSAPQLVSLTIPISHLNTSLSSQRATFRLGLTDDLSGVRSASLFLRSPSGLSRQAVGARISGTALNGVHELGLTLPACSEEGCWTVERIAVSDEVGNDATFTTAQLQASAFPTTVCLGFVPGGPRARIKAPKDGRLVRGQRLTVVGELVEGSPSDVASVRFESRPAGTASWTVIPAATSRHPNPDTRHPYFVHWDVSGLSAGDHELRAVATNLGGVADPNPAVVTVRVDIAQPDVVEELDPMGRVKKRSKVAATADTELLSGAGDAARLCQVLLPDQAVSGQPWLSVAHVDSSQISSPLLVGKLVVGGVRIELDSGQTLTDTDFAVIVSYPDEDDDGMVDGSAVPEGDLCLYLLNTSTGDLTPLGAQQLAATNNLRRASTRHVATIVLAERVTQGVLQGRVTHAGTGSALADAEVRPRGEGSVSRTDVGGNYQLELAAAGYTLEATRDGYNLATATATVTDGGVVTADLTLTPNAPSPTTGALRGVVTVAGSGLPLEGVEVRVGGVLVARTHATGDYAVGGLAPGSHLVEFSHPSYDAQASTQVAFADQTTPLSPQLVQTPAPTPTPSPSPSSSASPTPTPSATPAPTPSTSPAPAASPSPPASPVAGGGGGGGGGCALGPGDGGQPAWLALLLLSVLGWRRAARTCMPADRVEAA